MKQNSFLWAACMLVLLLPPVLAAGADFDLKRVNYPDPIIGVTFNEPVKLLDAQTNLLFIATSTFEGLAFTPTADAAYNAAYEITPSSGRLTQGEYVLSVVGRNGLGLANNPATVSFEVTGLNIQLYDPENGYSPTTPYDVTVQTYVLNQTILGDTEIPFNAECKYLLGPAPALDDFNNPLWKTLSPSLKSTDSGQYAGGAVGTIHTVTGLETVTSTFSVICQQYKLSGERVSKPTVEEFTIGYLDEGPEILINTTPSIITNPNLPFSEFSIITDQEATCTIAQKMRGTSNKKIPVGSGTEFNTTHKHIVRYDNDDGVNTDYLGNNDVHKQYYTIECTNRAGRTSKITTNVTVNFGDTLTINIEEPSTLTNKNPVMGVIATNKAASCTVDDRLMSATQGGLRHSLSINTASFENYTSVFFCEREEKNVTKNIIFRTDRVPPSITLINTTGFLCAGKTSAYFSANDNDAILRYEWALFDSAGKSLDKGMTGEYVEVTIPKNTTEQFSLRAYAVDRAGNNGSIATKQLITRQGTSAECSGMINGSPEGNCGDNIIQSGEQCDGSSLGTNTDCSTYNTNLVGIIISCNADCTYNMGACQSTTGGVGDTLPDETPPSDDTPSSDDTPPKTFSDPEEFPWLALILLLIGLLTMGGASYYLYDANNYQSPTTQQSATQPTTPPPMSRENTVSLLKQQQEEQRAFKEHAEQNTEERHKLTQTFGDATQSTPTKTFEETTAPERKSLLKEFSPESPPEVIEKKAEKKTKDVFERLDEFIDDVQEEKK